MRKLVIAAAWLLGFMVSAAGAAEPGTLTVWINSDKGYAGLDKVGQAYTAKTGVKVVVKHFDNAVNTFEEAMKAAGRKNAPDIWIWPHDRIGDWIQRGWIVPVQPNEDVRRNVVQVAWNAFTVGGKTWGYPLSVEAVALVYNKALVPVPPKSFEELPALHDKLKAKGVRAIGWETASPYFTWPMLAANGGYVFQRGVDGSYDARDSGLNHAGAIRGGEAIAKLIEAGVLPRGGMSYGEAEAAMQDGKQAMWITGPWAWEGLRENGIQFGVAPLPTVGGKPARPFVGVLGAMLVQGSPNQRLAVDFLENHVLTTAGLTQINQAKPLGVPASKSMFWTLYSDENIRASMEAIYAGRPMPSNPEMTFFWQHLASALTAINNGKPARQALDDAAAQVGAATRK